MFFLGCATMHGATSPGAPDASTELTVEGSRVLAAERPPGPNCESRGEVTGESHLSGVPPERLIRAAINDARNKAAAMGASYLHTQPTQLVPGEQGPTGATTTGTAYLCR